MKTPFQFRLRSIFVFTTVAGLVFAGVGQFGVDGLLERVGLALTIAAIFLPLVDFYRWWQENDMLK